MNLNFLGPSFILFISEKLECKVIKFDALSGGDISVAYRIETTKGNYFLKLNRAKFASKMFAAEAFGLESIAKTNSIDTPNVIKCGQFEDYSFLILEFLESKSPTAQEYAYFGKQLATLHNITSDSYGLGTDNFIGSLPQSNKIHDSWASFYYFERLVPQFNLSISKGLLKKTDFPSEEHFYSSLLHMFQDIKPSLLHGDLWSGNYLISEDGRPFLIDPAIYYGHSEVDIAMSKLFGGFGNAFYKSYFEEHPKEKFTDSRIEIYQLYYLLVHLNLFGSAYCSSVKLILSKYF